MPHIRLNNEVLTPDPLGAVYWAKEQTLVVSDLHFEKGSSFAERGIMLPPYDTRTTLMRLAALMRRYKPKCVISLGDAFHDGGAEERMDEEDAATLEGLMRATEWLWVLGNHDPELPARFAAPCEIELQIGALFFRHEPGEGRMRGEIAGHFHPCARVISEGRSLRRRCFAVSENRMIMPAMGAYTGGLNILDEAYAPFLARPVAWVMGAEGVYPIAGEKLAPDFQNGAKARA